MALLFNSTMLHILSVATNYSNPVFDLTNFLKTKHFLNLEKPTTQLFEKLVILTTSTTYASAERYMNSSELIRSHGYKVEEYTVTSGTGYLLNVDRIPGPGSPVLLVHGFTLSSDEFLTSGGKSLAFQLADAGFDVWLINCRGNVYSRKHIKLSPHDPAFWKFSFHEMGTEDVPTTIDFILNKTNRTKLAYVGHSQGTTVGYIMLSKRVEYNNKLSVMVSLSPIAWISQMFSPIVQIAARLRNVIETVFKALGVYEFLPSNALTKTITRDIFGSSRFTAAFLDSILFLVWGPNFSQIDYDNIQNQISHYPDGGSVMQVYHFLQEVVSGGFREYDFGIAKNIEVYGSITPPAYPVSEITCKMFFFKGNNDWLSSQADLDKLTARLQNVIGEYNVPGYNHLDYAWARDASVVLYSRIIDVIQSAN